MLRKIIFVVPLVVTAAAAVWIVGCNRPNQPGGKDASSRSTSDKQDGHDDGHKDHADNGHKDHADDGHKDHAGDGHKDHADDGGHHHAAGKHGGTIVSLGRDNYHVEAVFEKGGALRLYMLGKDESRVQEVEMQELTAYAKPEGGESVSFTLKAEPQPGDSEGKTSVFVGQLPEELRGKTVTVTIPSIRVGGERFRFNVTSAVDEHAADKMPAKVPDDAEAKLYLTPGGIYTVADIEANGNLTASQKFKGLRAVHDLKPKAGDKICPITLTKANPKFSWVVGGNTYEFCCPPCVDEFVTTAKETPKEIQEPEAYVKN